VSAPDIAGIYSMLARLHPERRTQLQHRAHTTRTASAMRSGGRWSTQHGSRPITRTFRTWHNQPRDEAGRFCRRVV
jgi:hypothetical protein